MKQFPSFLSWMPSLPGLAGDPFMPVQDHLGWEGWMAADFDREMPPVSIEDVERVVIDVGHRPFPLEMVLGADVPDRRLCFADEDQETPSVRRAVSVLAPTSMSCAAS